MGKRIVWQPKPPRQMRELESYLREVSGTNEAFYTFLNRLQTRLDRISEQPESGQLTGRRQVRYIHVDDHRSIFYRISRSFLQIILVWDSRQDPLKNPFFNKK